MSLLSNSTASPRLHPLGAALLQRAQQGVACAALALAGLVSLPTLAQPAPAAAPAAGPAVTLRWAAQNDILTLDPHSQNHSTTSAILMHAYEGLVRYDADRKIEPALSTKWTYLSPTQVRFELRRNVRFHDGTPFTADDVAVSYTHLTLPTTSRV